MAYVVPIISQCVRTLLCQASQSPPQSKHSTQVHGLVLVPTRELAIQVSKECKVAAKFANKYMSKRDGAEEDTATTLKVESMSVYGGVDIETQISSLLGKDESPSCQRSLVVAATAGRLLDIIKKSDSEDKPLYSSAFANLQAIVFDEADRTAVNADMAGQVDEILSILKSVREESAGVVSCLVSATLPEKVKEICENWVPRNRVVVQIDSLKMGKEQSTKKQLDDDEDSAKESASKTSADDEQDDNKKKHATQNLDLALIPPNIVHTLHVCSQHKKPKKLILTLQRIYQKKDPQGGRFSANNRLTIVFFSQIKILKYVSKLLVKENLRVEELYGSLDQTVREKRLLEFKAGKRV